MQPSFNCFRAFVRTGWFATASLVLCCLTLAVLVGDIGFQGDDWWIFSFPFWSPFPQSLWEYTAAAKRPVEGLYWISLFEVFRFNRVVYYLFSLFLLAGSCLLMRSCLMRSFPGRNAPATMSMLFAFVLPPVSNLIYMIHTDNSRISMVFFWLSVIAFQRWAARSASWYGLMTPILIYCLSVLTYENTSLLIFSIPFFVWPVYADRHTRLPLLSFLFRLSVGVISGFALFVALRFLVFSGGAVGHTNLAPPFFLGWSYLSTLMLFLAAPFSILSGDKWSWAWGVLVAAIAWGLLHSYPYLSENGDPPRNGCRDREYCYGLFLGAMVFLLGILPYLLAGYGAVLGFTSQSRIFSAGSFGLAIFLGFLLTPRLRNDKFRGTLNYAAIIILGFMAVFFADLRNGWKESADKRKELCASLLRQVPGVAEDTTLLFLDLQSYVSNRAVVFQGVDGLGEFVRMLYNKKKLNAYFLYPSNSTSPDLEGKTAVVSPLGIMARGSAVKGPSHLDSLLILEREGSQLVLLDRISADEKKAAIDWNGVTELYSNLDLILTAPRQQKRVGEICPK